MMYISEAGFSRSAQPWGWKRKPVPDQKNTGDEERGGQMVPGWECCMYCSMDTQESLFHQEYFQG